ncbi:LCP family protein [Brotaphodocola catenula]|uniref:LCP family protein n=1 Tax=Brotaphodocola catenula TaxID=2885361 RepID=A0AAE3DK55_9FIRM|nr:LCP family protein [Brotaphodocola catenula]MCC2164867.1 LCP family protein [Brotaphodocola catenula]
MDWLKKNREALRNALIGICMVGITVFVWYSVGLYRQRRATEEMIATNRANQTEMNQQQGSDGNSASGSPDSSSDGNTGNQENGANSSTDASGTPGSDPGSANFEEAEMGDYLVDLSQDMVTWNGKTYRRNTYIHTILCLGIDRTDDMVGTREPGEAGQSDGIYLIAQDTVRNQIKILMIPRDTMTRIVITDKNNQELGTRVDHLNIAYGYGDGEKLSCDLAKRAVTNLLQGIPIDRYMAVDIVVLSKLNDAVGGVTVTIPTDGMEKRDPAFVKGTQVTLHGDQAEAFIRYRDIERDNSALFRMNQHKEYMEQFFKAVKQKSKEDSQIVTNMFDMIQDYMQTDMPKNEYMKIAIDVLGSGNLGDDNFRMIPGVGTATDTYDEFHANIQQMIPILLQMFYREV